MRTLTEIKDKKTLPFTILLIFIFSAAYSPVFQRLFQVWSTSEEYSHAFLTLPIVIYMVWSKRDSLLDRNAQYSPVGLVLVLLAAICYFFATLTQVNTLIFLSLFGTIVGALVYLAGIRSILVLLTPLVILLILIPVPDRLYIALTFPLQLKVSQLSEMIVGLFGVPILREGNVMNIPGKSFEVVEACSGLRSIIALLTLSLIMGYFMLKRKTSKIILILTSIPIAIFVNIIRVSSMILLFHFFRLDLSEGFLHTVSGLIIFVIAFILLLFIHKVLDFWETR